MNRTTTRSIAVNELSRRRFLAMMAAGAGTIALSACGGGSAMKTPLTTAPATGPSTTTVSGSAAAGTGSLPLLMIEAVDYAFRASGTAPAGMTMVQMKNLGQEDHQTQFLRLNDGVTPAQVQAAFQHTDQGGVEKLTTLVGGPGTVAAGGTSAAMLNLAAGQYLLACFIPSRDGIAHAAKGMVLPLQITAAAGPAMPAPATRGTVTMKEFSFALSTSAFPPGRSMIAVVNEGAQAHEFGALRLAPGKSAADVTGYFAAKPAGPPPFSAAGGMTALSPGQKGIAVLDLTPGNYAAICFLPDPASGKEHLQLGMVAGFSVA